MRKNGKIILIEDDEDDREIFQQVYDSLGFDNELVILKDSTKAIEYIKRKDVDPFLIISDINMPMLSGFELRDQVLKDPALAEKSVPYIFFTTAQTPESIIEAYRKSVQGFFYKPNDISQFAVNLKMIIDYWKLAATPPYS